MSSPVDNELREQLAAIEHERWGDWQKYMHSQGGQPPLWDDEAKETAKNGLWFSREQIDRWRKQINTPYEQLSEREQASDMEQVDRYWPLVLAWHQRQLEARKHDRSKILKVGTKTGGWTFDGKDSNAPGITINFDGSVQYGGWEVWELENIVDLVEAEVAKAYQRGMDDELKRVLSSDVNMQDELNQLKGDTEPLPSSDRGSE